MPFVPTLPRFLTLYGALFMAFGAASPFLPALLLQDGLDATALGVVLAAGTAVRLVAGPFGGRLADRLGRAPTVLAGFTAASALVALGYVPARGLVPLAAVSVAHAAVLAPLTPLADALALGSAASGQGFRYGTVRGAGSAAFIAGTLLAGELVGRAGLGVIVWLNAGLLALSAAVATTLPNRLAGQGVAPPGGSAWALLRIAPFARVMAVAALVGGSHALHDGFEVIRWRAAGLSDRQAGILWSSSVLAEVAVFVLAGPALLRAWGPARCAALCAAAGMLRWGVAACTAAFGAMLLTEPLHGLTFALLHLVCMDVIGRTVPPELAATAQAFYATVAMGAVAALVTLGSGPLYGYFGAAGFWAMAAMCALALPLVPGLRAGRAV